MTQKTYHPQTAKFIATVCENMPELSGEVMQKWIENPKGLQQALREALSPNGKPTTQFPTWRTITLGAYKDVKSLKQALKENGFRVSEWASDILGQRAFELAKKKTEVNLVVLSVAELGFPKGATYREVCEKAKKQGLHLCPPEVGPALRYQYPDQPRGEWLTIAMEAITGSDGRPSVFRLDLDHDGWWLRMFWRNPGGFWYADDRFVFLSK